jgi:serine/threonine protein phosphatase PrpC
VCSSDLETDFLNKYISTNEIYTRLSYNNFKIIKNFYNQIDNKLKKKDYDSDLSGTTNCSIFIIGNHLICSNLGDSRAILIRKNNEIYNLSNDHKPNNKSEYERIIKKNGEIRKNNIDINNNFIDYNEINLNIKIPFRVFLKNKNIPGLAMSRSIGDFIAKKVGVINEPEILDIIINNNDKFIILASDGLWEFVSNEDVRDIVNKYYKDFNLKDAIKDLINFAIKKFENVGKYIDDITIILIFLNVEE